VGGINEEVGKILVEGVNNEQLGRMSGMEISRHLPLSLIMSGVCMRVTDHYHSLDSFPLCFPDFHLSQMQILLDDDGGGGLAFHYFFLLTFMI